MIAKDLYGRELSVGDKVLAFNIIKTSVPKVERVLTIITGVAEREGKMTVSLKHNGGRTWRVLSTDVVLMSDRGL